MVDPSPMAPQGQRKASTAKKKARGKKVAKKATKKPGKKALKKKSAKKATRKATNKAPGKAPGKAAMKPAANKTGTWKNRGRINRASTRKPVSKPPKLDMDADVMDFIAAMDAYKSQYHRPFPGWSEILFVIKRMGYKKA